MINNRLFKGIFISMLVFVVLVSIFSIASFSIRSSGRVETVSFEEFSSAFSKLLSYDNGTNMSSGVKLASCDGDAEDEEFASKTLLVNSWSKLDNCGAVAVAEGYDELHIYKYATVADTIKAYNYFKSLDEVTSVSVDHIVSLDSEETTQVSAKDYTDSISAEVMGIKKFTEKYLKNAKQEVIVAVLDTGIYSEHPWFKGRVLTEYAKNFSSSKTGNNDLVGHGTHVAGTIADLTPSNVKIVPVKVMNDNGRGAYSSIILGIKYCIELNKTLPIKAMNMSFGGSERSAELEEVIINAYNNGILSIVAAGNERVDVKNIQPANIQYAITVSAVGVKNNDNGYAIYRSSYSNYGSYVDVCAPGDDIVSASNTGGLAMMSGTSMATPHVVAAVSLLWSYNMAISLREMENLLKTNAIDLGETGFDIYYGYGLVNLTKKHPINIIYYNISDGAEITSGEIRVDDGANCAIDVEAAKYYVNNMYNCILIGLTINGSYQDITQKEIPIYNVDQAYEIILECDYRDNYGYIQVTASGEGKVTESSYVRKGGYKKLDFTPDQGYRVKDVLIDGKSVGAVEYYEFYQVATDHDVFVTFEEIQEVITHKISISIVGSGSYTCDKSLQEIEDHDSRTVVFFGTEEGWKLKSIICDETITVKKNTVIIHDIKYDITVYVEFAKEEQPVKEPTQPENPVDIEKPAQPNDPVKPGKPNTNTSDSNNDSQWANEDLRTLGIILISCFGGVAVLVGLILIIKAIVNNRKDN